MSRSPGAGRQRGAGARLEPGGREPSRGGERWGIYEKALPAGLSWRGLLEAAASAGYRFLEVSIDESEERLARLEWSAEERRKLRSALSTSPVGIGSMCLSAHRKYSLGSTSAPVRERGLTIMRRAVEFAVEFGVRIVQVAGYDVFYEESTEETRRLFQENLCRCAEWAREAGVMLGLENVDCLVADSLTKALRFVGEARTPWFQLYPDIGNLAAMGHDVPSQLREAGSHLVSLHVKDSRIREIRRVPYGEGIVDFGAVFRTLQEIDYRGPLVVEMWNEGEKDPIAVAARTLRWLEEARDAAQPRKQAGGNA